MVTHFLTFLSVTKTTAHDLFIAVSKFCEDNKLDMKNLIGIGTDGASNLCGSQNSLYTLLRKNFNLNDLILVKCICHSLHLCCSKASEVFSDDIDYLLKETYNWFRYSQTRMSQYKEIYNLINTDGNNTIKKFIKFTKLSTTRWLSRYHAVEKIYSQYL